MEARAGGPDRILALGFGFWGAKALLSAVELGLFTELAKEPLDEAALRARLGLNERSARDFFDALVALGLLERVGDFYTNTPEAEQFLDRAKPEYVGGLLEMANARLYGFWGSLTEALRTGLPQNEVKQGGDLFAALYADPERLQQFLFAMSGISAGPGRAIAARFPWIDYRTFADIGTAQGALPVAIASAHKHLNGVGFDLEPVRPIFDRYVAEQGLSDRLKFAAGDFFRDPLPRADVLIMGHILHDWDLSQKRELIAKAYEAIPPGGALIVYESLIDDERRQNAFGLLMSLNMLIETPGGFDFTGAQGAAWMREAGFRATRVESIGGPESMLIGIK